ncbi:hypothetical protein [Stomatohabitans albus]|uniref:hypothetical protein n=1 Tax=Stomatohabitans albus TaxID=3110766 RepID=UPI00300C12D0
MSTKDDAAFEAAQIALEQRVQQAVVAARERVHQVRRSQPLADLIQQSRTQHPERLLHTAIASGEPVALIMTTQADSTNTPADPFVKQGFLPVPTRADVVVDPWQIWEAKALGFTTIPLSVTANVTPDLTALIRVCDEVGIEPVLLACTTNEVREATAAWADAFSTNPPVLVLLNPFDFVALDAQTVSECLNDRFIPPGTAVLVACDDIAQYDQFRLAGASGISTPFLLTLPSGEPD